MKFKLNIVILGVVLLFLTSCTPHSIMNHPQITNEEVFLLEMIPHHEEAVEASQIMLFSQNGDVANLAKNIVEAQADEIAMMHRWREEWYPQSSYESTYSAMMPVLTGLEGVERDQVYLESMITHHEGAIKMAKQARSLNLKPEVRELVDNIVIQQQGEIEAIHSILGR